ncbi:hypothetical protein RF11_09660 [Thelohanellus kitauei]|uniref:Uncharacterized protein n=1 Tax=Thelohanellus kitauei TaxID=669202 RepID=A0A0C2MN37_THEKT|nr:hypothetical protein RF11_09660 [Thelohanellus kitauei]
MVSRILPGLILFLHTVQSLQQQPRDVSETGRMTSKVFMNIGGLAIKIIECFRDKNVPICQKKPEEIDVTECAKSSILDGMKYGFYNIDAPRAFQEKLFLEMKSRITGKGAFHDNVILQMEYIVKKIINDNDLTNNDYIEVYCHLHVAASIVENMLKLLADKLPDTYQEVDRTKIKVSMTKNHLYQSITNLYGSEKILIVPELSKLVSLVLEHDLGESCHIHDILETYVTTTLEAIEAYERNPDIRELGIFSYNPTFNIDISLFYLAPCFSA